MSYDVAINHDGYTETLYETCGSTMCVNTVLYAVGMSRGTLDGLKHPLDVEGHPLDVNVWVNVLPTSEQDACTWCAGCGDFISHGLSCDCAERGHDPEQDREPMGVGHIDLRDSPRFKAWMNHDENLLNEQDDATRGDAIRYEHNG